MEENIFKNLLLIDDRTNDIDTVINSIDSLKTSYLIIDYEIDTLDTIKEKIFDLGLTNISNIGIFQENYNTTVYKFIESFGNSVLVDVENVDPELTSWSQFNDLLQYFKTLGMSNLDLLGCNIHSNSNWNYIINNFSTDLSISIQSSVDSTGSSDLGGNWILESDNSDLINKYFNTNIYNYKYILGSSPVVSTTPILLNNGTALIQGGSSPIYFKNESGTTLTGIISVTGGGPIIPAGIEGSGALTNFGESWSYVNNDNLLARSWTGVAVSSSGQYITAVTWQANNDTSIWVSSDYGLSWINRTGAMGARGVAMSSDGQYQTVVASDGSWYGIWRSTNYGQSFTRIDPVGSSQFWLAIAMSSSGQYQTALYSINGSGMMYVSSNYGANWTVKYNTQNYSSLAMSASGQHQIATIYGGNSIKSSNYGVNWSADTTIASSDWRCAALSSDGTYRLLGNGGNIYRSSNSGSTWIHITTIANNSKQMMCCKISSDGKFQVIVTATAGQIWVSTDFGVNWAQKNLGGKNWNCVDLSPNMIVVAGSSQAQLSISVSSNVTLPGTYYALTSDGSVYAMGSNCCNGNNLNMHGNNERYSVGLLGQGSNNPFYYSSNGLKIKLNSSTFVTGAIQVEATGDSYAILLSNGKVIAGGTNGNGRCGQNIITGACLFASYVVDTTGTGHFSGVKKIAIGAEWLLMLKTDGTVWGCGSDVYKIQGASGNISKPTQVRKSDNNFITSVTDISCGYDHQIIFGSSNVFAGGVNTYGQLGNGTTTSSLLTPMKLSSTQGVSYNVNGIAAGKESSLVLFKSMSGNASATTNGVYGCGRNLNGELGIGNTTQQNFLTRMRLNASTFISGDDINQIEQYPYRSVILYNNGTVKAVGNFLGIPGYTSNQTYPVDYTLSGSAITNVSSISSRSVISTTVSDLIASGWTLSNLKSAGYTVAQLKSSYTASQLYTVGYTASELCAGGYSVTELQQITPTPPTAQQIITAGYTLSVLKSPGNYSASQLKQFGNYTASQMFSVSFTASELCTAGYTVTELQQITPTPPTAQLIITAGYTLSVLKSPGNYSASQLKQFGNYTASQMFNESFTVSQLFTAGYTVTELQQITPTPPTAQQIITAGYTLSVLKSPGNYSASQLKQFYTGCTASLLYGVNFTAIQLYEAGYLVTELQQITPTPPTAQVIIGLGYSLNILKSPGNYTASQLKQYYTGVTASLLYSVNFTAIQLYEANYLVTELQQITPIPPTAQQIIQAGYSLSILKSPGNYTVGELKEYYTGVTASLLYSVNFNVSDLYGAGYLVTDLQQITPTPPTASQIINTGYSVYILRTDGLYSVGQLKQYSTTYTLTDFVNGGYSGSQLRGADYSITDLKGTTISIGQIITAGYELSALKNEGGYSAGQLKEYGSYSASQLYAENYTVEQLCEGGYGVVALQQITPTPPTVQQIIQSGYSLSVLKSPGNYTASQLKQFYTGVTASLLYGVNFTASDLYGAEYLVTELQQITPTPPTSQEIIQSGYSLSDLKSPGNYSAGQLREYGNYSASQLYAVNYTAEQLCTGGYSVTQLQQITPTPPSKSDIINAGYTMEILRDPGLYTLADLLEFGNFFGDDLSGTDFTASDLFNNGFSAEDLCLGGYLITDLQEITPTPPSDELIIKAGYSLSVLKSPGGYSVAEIKQYIITYTASDYYSVNYTAEELFAGGFSITALKEITPTPPTTEQIINAGYEISTLKNEGGYSASQLKEYSSFTASDLYEANYTVEQLCEGGYPVTDLQEITPIPPSDELIIKAGYDLSTLKNVGGYSVYDIKQYITTYTASDFYSVNYSTEQLYEGGFSITALKEITPTAPTTEQIINAGYEISLLKNEGGYSVGQLKEYSSFTASDLYEANYTAEQLCEGGYSVTDLQEITPIPPSDESIIKAGYSLSDLKNFGSYSVGEIKQYITTYTASDFYAINYTAEELCAGGFSITALKEITPTPPTVEQIIDAGYSLNDLKNEGEYSAGQLKQYGDYSASELYDVNFSVENLYEGGYDIISLQNIIPTPPSDELIINAGYSLSELKNEGGYLVDELREYGNYNVTDLLGVSFSPEDLYTGGFTIDKLKEVYPALLSESDIITAGYDVYTLKNIGGYSATQLLNNNFDATELYNNGNGYSIQELKDTELLEGYEIMTAGYSTSELRLASYSITDLEGAGFQSPQIAAAGFDALDLFNEGYDASELVDNYSIDDLKLGGYLDENILNAGFPVTDLLGEGYSLTIIQEAGYPASDLVAEGYSIQDLFDAGYDRTNIIEGGYDVSSLVDEGFSASELISSYTPSDLIGYYDISVILDAGYTPIQLGSSLDISVLTENNVDSAIIAAAGYSADILFEAEIDVTTLINNYNPSELLTGGYNKSDVANAGFSLEVLQQNQFTASDLHSAGYSAQDIHLVYDVTDLIDVYDDSEIIAAGYPASDLLGHYDVLDLKTTYSALDLRNSGFNDTDIIAAGYSASKLLEANYQVSELNPSQTVFSIGTTFTVTGPSKNYNSVSLSSTGEYQTATVGGEYVYVSTNYGITWTAKITDANRSWGAVSISGTGQYQTVVGSNTQIYISTDFGDTWTAVENQRGWVSISVSGTGQYQSATVYGGYIYKSSDYGATWTSTNISSKWVSISVSSTGQYQTAVDNKTDNINGNIYVSSDYGNTWTTKGISGLWTNVSISGTGQYQTAGIINGSLYISNDYGNTWVEKSSFIFTDIWPVISVSNSGKCQLVCAGNNYNVSVSPIYISSDYGNTWTLVDNSKLWGFISISSSENYLSALVFDGNNGNMFVNRILKTTTASPSAYSAAVLDSAVSSIDGSKFSKSDIITAGYPIQDLFDIGYTTIDVHLSYSITDLKNIYQKNDILNAGYSIPDLKNENYSISDFKSAGYTADRLIQYYNVSDLLNIYTNSEIIDAGYPAVSLLSYYSVTDLKEDYSASDLRTAGYSDENILNADFPPLQLLVAGFPISDVYTKYEAIELKNVYLDSDVITCGYSANDLRIAGFTAKKLRDSGSFDAVTLQAGGYDATALKGALYLASDIYTLYSPANLRSGGYSKSDIINSGYSASDFKTDNFYSVSDLYLKFSAKVLREANYNDSDIINVGYSADKLKEALFTAGDLKTKYSVLQLEQGGYLASELYDNGFFVSQLKNIYTMNQIINSGYSISILRDDGYTAKNLVDNGKDINLLRAGGYTANEMRQSTYSVTTLKNILNPPYTTDEIVRGEYSASELRLEGGYLASDLKDVYTVPQIKAGGYQLADVINTFTTSELRSDGNGYTADLFKASPFNYSSTKLKLGNFTALELRNANYTLDELIAAPYTASNLRSAQYLASELRPKGFQGSELKTAGYIVADMLAAGFTFANLVSLAYNATELRIGGFTIANLKAAKVFKPDAILAAGYSVYDLKTNGFTAAQMKTANYKAKDLFDSTFYTMVDIKKAGYTAAQLKVELFTAAQLKAAGFKAIELKNLFYPVLDVVNAYTIKDIRSATYTVDSLRQVGINPIYIFTGGYSLQLIKQGGFTIQEMSSATYNGTSFTGAQLKTAGYSATELRSVNYSLNALKTLKYTPQNLKDALFSANELRLEGFAAKILRGIGFTLNQLIVGNYIVKDLKSAGYTATDLWLENVSAADVRAGGFTVPQMKTGGYTLSQFKQHNILLSELKKSYTLTELLQGEYNVTQLKAVAFTAAQFKAVGVNALTLKNDFTATLLKAAKYTAKELYDAGFQVSELATAKYTVAEIKSAGYEIYLVQQSFYDAALLKKGGYTATELKSYFTATQFKNAKFTAIELGPNGANFTAIQLGPLPDGAGFDVKSLKAAGFNANQLGPNGAKFTAKLMRAGGFNDATELKNAGFGATELKGAGFTAIQLGPNGANFTATELGPLPNGANFDVKSLKAAGFSANQLGPNGVGFTAILMRAGGFTDALVLKNAGFTYQNLLDAKFTPAQLTAAGF
jgi:hypothetical protein